MDKKALAMRRVKKFENGVVGRAQNLDATIKLLREMIEVFSKPRSDDSDPAASERYVASLRELASMLNDIQDSYRSIAKSAETIKTFLNDHENDKSYATSVIAISTSLGYPIPEPTLSNLIFDDVVDESPAKEKR